MWPMRSNKVLDTAEAWWGCILVVLDRLGRHSATFCVQYKHYNTLQFEQQAVLWREKPKMVKLSACLDHVNILVCIMIIRMTLLIYFSCRQLLSTLLRISCNTRILYWHHAFSVMEEEVLGKWAQKVCTISAVLHSLHCHWYYISFDLSINNCSSIF